MLEDLNGAGADVLEIVFTSPGNNSNKITMSTMRALEEQEVMSRVKVLPRPSTYKATLLALVCIYSSASNTLLLLFKTTKKSVHEVLWVLTDLVKDNTSVLKTFAVVSMAMTCVAQGVLPHLRFLWRDQPL